MSLSKEVFLFCVPYKSKNVPSVFSLKKKRLFGTEFQTLSGKKKEKEIIQGCHQCQGFNVAARQIVLSSWFYYTTYVPNKCPLPTPH